MAPEILTTIRNKLSTRSWLREELGDGLVRRQRISSYGMTCACNKRMNEKEEGRDDGRKHSNLRLGEVRGLMKIEKIMGRGGR